MTAVDNLIKGAIDMHVHFSPDSLIVRRQDALELAQSARDLGLRGLVLKSREFNTIPLAMLASRLVPEVQVFGSITLDNESGGLNPSPALAAARMGAKIIWMPTITALNSKAKTEKHNGYSLPGEGQTILNSKGKLKSEAREIFQIAKEFNIILASGHLSPKEVFTLAEEAQRIKFNKFLVTHALQSQLEDIGLSMDEVNQLARGGAYIEHSFWGWMPSISNWDAKMLADSIKATGAERCIMSSDFGQYFHPVAPEGLRLFIATMLRKDITEKDVEMMVKTNPAKLLGLT